MHVVLVAMPVFLVGQVRGSDDSMLRRLHDHRRNHPTRMTLMKNGRSGGTTTSGDGGVGRRPRTLEQQQQQQQQRVLATNHHQRTLVLILGLLGPRFGLSLVIPAL